VGAWDLSTAARRRQAIGQDWQLAAVPSASAAQKKRSGQSLLSAQALALAAAS
jgi:hypothetical protein